MFKGARAIAVGVVVMVVAVGCGGSSGEKVTVDATPAALRHAAQVTLDKGTSKVEFTVTMTIQGHEVTLPGTGAMDPANKVFDMSFDAKDLFTKLAGDKSVPPEVASSFDQPIEVIVDHTVMYMHFALLAALGGGGKEWVKIDLAAANKDVGDLLGGGGGAFGADPSSFLQFLEGTGKVTEVGTEDVRGSKTTHFSGSYTMKDALAALPADQRDKAEKAFTNLGLSADAESQEIPFDAWVDGDGLVRRIETSFDPSTLAPAGGNAALPGKLSMRMEFFDFGAPVGFHIPSDDEVQDLSNLVSQGSKFRTTASSIN